jgi:hypothetical protein
MARSVLECASPLALGEIALGRGKAQSYVSNGMKIFFRVYLDRRICFQFQKPKYV